MIFKTIILNCDILKNCISMERANLKGDVIINWGLLVFCYKNLLAFSKLEEVGSHNAVIWKVHPMAKFSVTQVFSFIGGVRLYFWIREYLEYFLNRQCRHRVYNFKAAKGKTKSLPPLAPSHQPPRSLPQRLPQAPLFYGSSYSWFCIDKHMRKL